MVVKVAMVTAMSLQTTEWISTEEFERRYGTKRRTVSYWCMRHVDAGRPFPAPGLRARRAGMRDYEIEVDAPADASR